MVPVKHKCAFEDVQFAYRKKHGARDAILYYALSWISGLNQGFNIGMYCSDVQGAFDKVDAELLICKLASFNFESCILAVVSSWLRDRSAFVSVNGKRSHHIRLRDMVFQGTVWGPLLWNAFFWECGFAIRT